MPIRFRPLALLLLLAGSAHAQHTGHAPAQTVRPNTASAQRQPTAADVAFIGMMIPHHSQALAMTALIPARTTNRAVAMMGRRIEVSQRDEIAWMKRWLTRHGAEIPPDSAMLQHSRHGMMGMLTPAGMDALAAATGADFDRLFLEGMIQHHQGARVMVGDLFATPGAAQLTDVYQFASDVESDQRIEIERMQAMLAAVPSRRPAPAPTPHHHR